MAAVCSFTAVHPGRPAGRLGVLLALLGGASGSAWSFDAATWYSNGRSYVEVRGITASEAITSIANGAKATGAVTMPGEAGTSVAARVAVNVGAGDVLAGAARFLARTTMPLAITYAAWQAYSYIRVAPDGAGGLARDIGQNEAPMGVTIYCANSNDCTYPTILAVIQRSDGSRPCSGTYKVTTVTNYNTPGNPYTYTAYINGQAVTGTARDNGWSGTATTRWCSDNGLVANSNVGGNVVEFTRTVNQCPGYHDYFRNQDVLPGSAKGPDGKCPTGAYTQPMTAQDAADMRNAAGNAPDYPTLLREATGAGTVAIPSTQDGTFDGNVVPSVIPGPTTQTTEDGVVTTTATEWDFVPDSMKTSGSWVEKKTTTRIGPDGQPQGSPKVETNAPQVPQQQQSPPPQAQPQEVKMETCGLPGKPACKIDETGTPTATPLEVAPQDTAKQAQETALGTLATRTAPTWSWSFSLPSSCSPINLAAFAPFVTTVDVCQFQPVIHDIMTLVWIGATLWGCIAMVGRTLHAG